MPEPYVLMPPAPQAQAAPYSPIDIRAHTKPMKDGCCSLCSPLADISPLIPTPSGLRINPMFDVVKSYQVAGNPYSTTLAAGLTGEVALTVDAEENEYGDMLISHLIASQSQVAPNTGIAPTGPPAYPRFAVFIKSTQNDKTFMNVPILGSFVFGTPQFSKSLPCCFLIQAANFAQIRLISLESTLSQTIRISAKGTRVIPYRFPEIRDKLLAYWNQYKSTPFYLGIDTLIGASATVALVDGGGLTIPASGTTTVTGILTVPGGGDFELKRWMVAVEAQDPEVYVDPSSIDIRVSEGVGRQMMNQAINLADWAHAEKNASQGSEGSGIQGGISKPSDGGHGEIPQQFLKRNSRIRAEITNNSGQAITIWLAGRGCMHYYDECPPDQGLMQAYSLEPMIGPMLVESPRCPPGHEFAPDPRGGMVPVNGPAPMIPQTGFVLPGTNPGVAPGMGRFRRPMGGVQPADGGFRRRGSW